MLKKLDIIVAEYLAEAGENDEEQMMLDSLRYGVLRKLSPREFTELFKRNLNGENFDNMVDELVIREHNPQ